MYYGLLGLAAKVPASGYGTLTTAWIAATGETDLTILGALNTLESDLTTYGLTSKMKALYPFVGGTPSKHKFNFMDARDLDAAYRLVFNGGWTHSSTGALPNGTNGYADTKLIPSSALTQNDSHVSIYNRTNTDGLYVDMGSRDASAETIMLLRWSNATLLSHNSNYGVRMNPSNSDSRGHFVISRRGANELESYKNSSSISTSSDSSNRSTYSIYLSTWNDSGSANYFNNRELAFSSIGDGLTDTEASNFYTAVQTFQTTLGRQVGVPIVSDADAQAFLNAAVITDTTQASAVNTLVTSLKADGLWTKMKAIYPFVGGTASTHKWNLKNPVDSDAAFRLVFSGGLTHDSDGIKGNATNAYYDTKFNPSVHLTSSTGGSAFLYCNNSVADNGSDLAANQSGVNTRFQVMASYAGSFYASMLATNLYSASNTATVGFFGATREPSNTTSFYAVKDTNSYSYSDSFANPNSNVAGLCVCTDSTSFAYFTGRRHSFSCMGEGLTTTQAQNLRTAVIAFNTTLGR